MSLLIVVFRAILWRALVIQGGNMSFLRKTARSVALRLYMKRRISALQLVRMLHLLERSTHS